MKEWVEEKGRHVLYFTPFYEKEKLAELFLDDGNWWGYESELLGVYGEYLNSDAIGDAKEEIESTIESHYEGERNYYQELLDKFRKEEGE